jgi:nucleotide-binding universal stress UspA family protein
MTNVTKALYWTLDPDVCRTCKARIFAECNSGLLPDGFRRQRLMLATDGSEFSRAPQEIAIALARAFGVTLDIMTSVHSPEDDETARARLMMATRAALVAGVDTEEIVRHGKHPVKEVLGAATAADTNILIVGRRPAHGDLKERLLGDVATHILAQAPCHVLIAGWQSQMWQNRILVASDGSTDSDHAAEVAAQIAKTTGTPVTLIAAAAPGKARDKALEDLELKAGQMKLEGIACETRIVEGALANAIVSVTQELGADLVVVGNHHRLGGGMPDRVIGSLNCAVLVVHSGAAAPDIDSAVANQA